jgi:16S rRNA processing protein RimM
MPPPTADQAPDPSGPEKPKSGPEFLILARVLRPHGVRGDLSVQVITSFPERMRDLDVVYVGADPAEPRRLTEQHVTWARRHKNDQWLIHLDGIEDRDEADAFRSQYVCVSLADAVPLEDDEVYLFQVIGLDVHTVEGEALGRVIDIIETGANDVYVVRGENYGEILIPAIDDVILNISVETGVMTVRLPAGLLPDRG